MGLFFNKKKDLISEDIIKVIDSMIGENKKLSEDKQQFEIILNKALELTSLHQNVEAFEKVLQRAKTYEENHKTKLSLSMPVKLAERGKIGEYKKNAKNNKKIIELFSEYRSDSTNKQGNNVAPQKSAPRPETLKPIVDKNKNNIK